MCKIIVEVRIQKKFIEFGRIKTKDCMKFKLEGHRLCTHWVRLSEDAWAIAHEERRQRYTRLSSKREWEPTQGKS